MRTILTAAALVAYTIAASAHEARMYQCASPQGKRVQYGGLKAFDGTILQRFQDGPKWSDDAYGDRPVVVIDQSTMLVSWPNYVPEILHDLVDNGRHVERVPITGRDEVSVWDTTTTARTVAIWRYYLNYNVLYLIKSKIVLFVEDLRTAPSMAAIYISPCEPM
jgi:hypothetical protein